MDAPCLLDAWSAHENELRAFLRHRTGNAHDADELLQETFLKALRQGRKFCSVENTRAWLFQVARNTLTDKLRGSHVAVSLPDHDVLDEILQAAPADEMPPVEDLSQCLPRVLSELSENDRLAITLCDIEGRPQQELADRLGISLPGAKSRIQRARVRLQEQLVSACQVKFDENGHVCSFTPRPLK